MKSRLEDFLEIAELSELLAEELLPTTADLNALCRTSHTCCRATVGILYRTVHIDLAGEDHLLNRYVAEALCRYAPSVRSLYFRVLGRITDLPLVARFIYRLQPFPKLRCFCYDRLGEGRIRRLIQRLVPTDAQFKSLVLPVVDWHRWSLPLASLMYLCVEDIYIDEDHGNTFTLEPDVFKQTSCLKALVVDNLDFRSTPSLGQLPQLEHLHLRQPRGIGYLPALCTELAECVLEDCGEEQAVSIVSASSSIELLFIRLLQPCVMTEALATAIKASRKSVNYLWFEGSRRAGGRTDPFFEVSEGTWSSLAAELSSLQVLSIDYPFAAQINVQHSPSFGKLSDLLRPVLPSMRHLILRERYGGWSGIDPSPAPSHGHFLQDCLHISSVLSTAVGGQRHLDISIGTQKYQLSASGEGTMRISALQPVEDSFYVGRGLDWAE